MKINKTKTKVFVCIEKSQTNQVYTNKRRELEENKELRFLRSRPKYRKTGHLPRAADLDGAKVVIEKKIFYKKL